MIGKDADKNEYWFFKEELGKLFIKMFEPVNQLESMMDIEDPNGMNMDIFQPAEPKAYWGFYDTEEEFEKLVEACNIKGVRERKL
jgi:hypothetical protein